MDCNIHIVEEKYIITFFLGYKLISITFAFTCYSSSNFFYRIYNKLKKKIILKNKVDGHNHGHANIISLNILILVIF